MGRKAQGCATPMESVAFQGVLCFSFGKSGCSTKRDWGWIVRIHLGTERDFAHFFTAVWHTRTAASTSALSTDHQLPFCSAPCGEAGGLPGEPGEHSCRICRPEPGWREGKTPDDTMTT